MIRSALALCLVATLPMAAQAPKRAWYFGVQSVAPTFEGRFSGIQDDKAIEVDLQKDLAIKKETAKIGFALEYQGPRFGLEFAMDEQDYKGANFINRKISISGQDYNAGAYVTTDLKMKNYTFNWTIRALKFEHAWIGIDLGARIWDMDLKAIGVEALSGVSATAIEQFPIPIPQLGLSVGFQAINGAVIGKAYYHTLVYSGAKYHRVGADLRYFPLKWLGVRAFMDQEAFDVPKGSIQDDLDIRLDRNGAGFGVMVRF
ncbi:MAG: hypothetical protein Q8O00_12180 [Holophaga sp.]|nr:hypothetical protein [Holophaga sp.]